MANHSTEKIMTKSVTALRLTDKTKSRLEALSKTRDRSPHYLMTKAVEQYLDHEEAVEAERQLVRSRWEKFELTGEAIDHSDVKAWAANLGKKKKSAGKSKQI